MPYSDLERRRTGGWVWGVLALLLLLVVGWWATGRDDARLTAVDAAAPDSAVVIANAAGDVGREDATAAVTRFLSFADSGSARASAGIDHAYTAEGVRRLAGAIAALSLRDSIAGTSEAKQVDALETLAGRLQVDPTALTHADVFRAAATSSAQLLTHVQERRFPMLGGEVGALREAAEAIAKDRPLLDQRAEVDVFFNRAARVVRAMDITP